MHVDRLVFASRNPAAREVRLDGKLAVSPVDEHHQLHPFGPAVVQKTLQGRPHGTAGVEHVVHQQQGPAGDGKIQLGCSDDGLRPDQGQVVPIEVDVQDPQRQAVPRQILDIPLQTPRQGNSAAADPHQSRLLDVRMGFDQIPGDLQKRALHFPIRHQQLQWTPPAFAEGGLRFGD